MASVTESIDSTGFRQNFTGDALEVRREFNVQFTAAEVTEGSNTDFVAQSLIPVVLGQVHPTITNAFCETIECRKQSDSNTVFRVVAIYKGNTFAPPDGNGGEETNQTFTLSTKAVPKLVYRIGAQVPTDGTPTDADIGGTAIDVNGKPTSIVAVESTVTVNMSLEIDTSSPANYISGIQGLVGKRNNATFLGASKGRLLYTGATVAKVSGSGANSIFKVSHTFAFDSEFHCKQVAESTDVRPSGVQLGKDVGNSTYEKNAFKVLFKQPFTEFSDFNALQIDISG